MKKVEAFMPGPVLFLHESEAFLVVYLDLKRSKCTETHLV